MNNDVSAKIIEEEVADLVEGSVKVVRSLRDKQRTYIDAVLAKVGPQKDRMIRQRLRARREAAR
ncbi:MAG: hypothetical protein AAB533_00015 [Patescibacteria group bacterium]